MTPKTVAVIDLGTNTFQLGIAKIAKGKFEYIYETSLAPKLGKGGINKGIISADAMERALDALKIFSSLCVKYKVPTENVRLIGTSALRNASNAQDFLDLVNEKFNWQIDVIDGDKEAEYIAAGVQYAFNDCDLPYVIMDIGGGSVELIIVENSKIQWKQSFEIGGQRLMDLFFTVDPMPNSQINRLIEYLQIQLLPLVNAVHQYAPKILLGSAGSFETLLDIYNAEIQGSVVQNLKIIDDLPIESFYKSYQKISSKNRNERLEIPGMISLRVDMIVVASVLIDYVLKACNISQIKVSSYALKEGILARIAQK